MKQTSLIMLLVCLFCSASNAYYELSDSSSLPISHTYSHEYSKPSLVGGFTLGSLFEESENFLTGSWIFHLGSGFKSDVIAEQAGLKKTVPPSSLLLEKSIGKNFGIGIRGGFRLWKIPKLDYQYHYYSVSIRGTYHFNIHPKIDPYVGLSGVGRLVQMKGNQPQESNQDYDYAFFLGCRYYLKSRLGIFVEYGSDGLTQYHGGLVFKLR